MSNPINNTVFDSRDLIEYKEELENDILDAYIDWAENHNEYKEEETEELEIPDSFDEIEFLNEESFIVTCSDLIEEYEDIEDFCEELENNSSDFKYGESIIHESYFEEYCEDFCRDCGYIADNTPAIIENNIDWAGIAEDMKIDYAEVEYNGETYYIR
ncbi:MAG: hypothetical protein CMH22_05985 [Methylophaga sp.]|nr:hypothetical protein [Methylophaga sp.]|tara:strand:+ start:64472 stop:64945 length:474 start_codon:yes stop_codon:yes gene_type:complete